MQRVLEWLACVDTETSGCRSVHVRHGCLLCATKQKSHDQVSVTPLSSSSGVGLTLEDAFRVHQVVINMIHLRPMTIWSTLQANCLVV